MSNMHNEYASIGTSPEIINTITELKNLARNDIWADDPDLMIDDYAGGNVEDAFGGGYRSGQTELARDLLSSFGISWK